MNAGFHGPPGIAEEHAIVCPRCQRGCERIKESRSRCVRDLPILERPVMLWLHMSYAISFRPEQLPQFDRYLVNEGLALQDFLIYTHGSRDAACGQFGYRLYDRLRRLATSNPQLRIWRVSHFGGHVFAPTMIELPAGIFWGNLYNDRAEQVVARRGDVTQLRLHYRGWSGAARGFAQAAEREMLMCEGWHWIDTARTVQVTAQDPAEHPEWAEVQIACGKGYGHQHLYSAHVAVSHYVKTIASTGQTMPHAFARYQDFS